MVAHVVYGDYLEYFESKKARILTESLLFGGYLGMWPSDGRIGGWALMAFIPSAKALCLKMGACRRFSNASEHFRRSFRGLVYFASYSTD